MTKKIIFVFALVLPMLLIVPQAFAQDGGAGFSDTAIKYITYFFGMAIAVFGGTAAQSQAATAALEGIARNPAAADKIQTPMILGLALMESLVIFMLISVFLAG